MVDVSNKDETARTARATGVILMNNTALGQIRHNAAKKGDVLAVARVAGIMAGKKTSELIPMCHQLNLSKLKVDFELTKTGVIATTMATVRGQTGVEMEALTACSVALLTIYDMCKAVDRAMIIRDVKLLEKSGGASGNWRRSND